MCGIMTDYDTVQNKIKNGYIFKVKKKQNGSFWLLSDVCVLVIVICCLGSWGVIVLLVMVVEATV